MKVKITKVPDKKSESLNARHWKHEDGGPIQRAISSNKADVVLAAIRKMKSDVTL